MKVMISQPMQGKTAQEIVAKRDGAAAYFELMWHEAAVAYGLTILYEAADE